MPLKPDSEDMTPDDVEQILQQGLEDMAGKPTNHGSIELNIEALLKRVEWIDREARLMSTTAANPDCDLGAATGELARLRQEKAAAQQRITDLELMLKNLN